MARPGNEERTTASPDGGKLAMGRGRPSLKEVARIEQAILNIARDLFLAEGFEGVSMERVAARTGITRATLYSRHRTKAALFRAVIEGMLAERYAKIPPLAQHPPTDIALVLRQRVSDMAAVLADPLFRAFHRLILSNRHRFPELGPLMHDVGYRRAVDLLAHDIRAAAARDGIPSKRPEVVAEHILTAIHGWFLQYDLVRDLTEADIEAHGHGVVELLVLSRERW